MHERPGPWFQPATCGPPVEAASNANPVHGGQLAEDGTEGFPFDPDFPQLPIASNPRLMLDIFRTELKPVAEKRYEIQECRPFRFRCRQSKSRCVLQYTLRIADPSTGRRWDQSVTGLLYADKRKAERRWHEMQATDPRRGIPKEWLAFEPVSIISGLGMLVQIFPFDRRLRNLGPIMGGAGRTVDPLLLARLGPGEWEVENRTIEPTRYRTERGAALRYAIQAREARSARRGTVTCYLKVYRNDDGAETWRFLLASQRLTAEGTRPYETIRPIAYLSDLRTLVIEEAPGRPLSQLSPQSGHAAQAVRSVARALAAFHQDEIPATRHESLADRLEAVRKAGLLIQWACPGTRDTVQAIIAAVTNGLEEASPAPIHGDLKSDHVFVSDERVVFIDLDSVAFGDPVRDVASLFAHLTCKTGSPSMPADRAREMAAAFADEYFRHAPSSWRARFGLHSAGAFLEVAGCIFRSQEPGWPETTARIVEEAQRACEEVQD